MENVYVEVEEKNFKVRSRSEVPYPGQNILSQIKGQILYAFINPDGWSTILICCENPQEKLPIFLKELNY